LQHGTRTFELSKIAATLCQYDAHSRDVRHHATTLSLLQRRRQPRVIICEQCFGYCQTEQRKRHLLSVRLGCGGRQQLVRCADGALAQEHQRLRVACILCPVRHRRTKQLIYLVCPVRCDESSELVRSLVGDQDIERCERIVRRGVIPPCHGNSQGDE